jgi:hypothetical protein
VEVDRLRLRRYTIAGVCGAIWLATRSLASLALGALPC